MSITTNNAIAAGYTSDADPAQELYEAEQARLADVRHILYDAIDNMETAMRRQSAALAALKDAASRPDDLARLANANRQVATVSFFMCRSHGDVGIAIDKAVR